jgi:RecA/RadA recombinase
MSNAPKTAYELAMERLRKKDADAGIVHERLTDEQKAEIAEVRRVAEARTAELKILHQSAVAAAFDPAERESIEAGHRADLQRVADDRERKIARIREPRG